MYLSRDSLSWVSINRHVALRCRGFCTLIAPFPRRVLIRSRSSRNIILLSCALRRGEHTITCKFLPFISLIMKLWFC
jgi:hypothetical protein